ncbi:MAG TPA: SpoIIE family protein phosphatase [Actinomycetota bacterium]|nr:SpoIIE family protein phosphatase [Actinomycetota bacterium]
MARTIRRGIRRGFQQPGAEQPRVTAPAQAADVHIAPTDPILEYFRSADGPVDLEKLVWQSPGLQALRDAGVKLVVPLVSQGELIGLLNLGPRLSEQEYSTDDRKLLENLASQTAPAVRVAQLVREQEAEIRKSALYEQELQMAHLIQNNLLPKEPPQPEGWCFAAHYQSAREVGGDFYDFIDLPDGRLGIVIGDVTDKGVPAALVMASVRSLLRAAAQRLVHPPEVLQRVNDQSCPDMPPKMFATCLYGVLDPASGRFRFSNAGHNLPYRKTSDGVEELRARGMPLGLMPGMAYEEKEVVIEPGETLLFSSDGIAEAHSAAGEMYGCPRMMQLVARHPGGATMMDGLLEDLSSFTGPNWDQEDDITLVAVERKHQAARPAQPDRGGQMVERFSVPSSPGNEREVMAKVAEMVADAGLEPRRLEKLKTAVAEATMNAIEHGNKNDPDVPVEVAVTRDSDSIRVQISDQGGEVPVAAAVDPDLDKKIAGQQTPRGWGLFLIKNMVDEMNVATEGSRHTVELVVNLSPQGESE